MWLSIFPCFLSIECLTHYPYVVKNSSGRTRIGSQQDAFFNGSITRHSSALYQSYSSFYRFNQRSKFLGYRNQFLNQCYDSNDRHISVFISHTHFMVLLPIIYSFAIINLVLSTLMPAHFYITLIKISAYLFMQAYHC